MQLHSERISIKRQKETKGLLSRISLKVSGVELKYVFEFGAAVPLIDYEVLM